MRNKILISIALFFLRFVNTKKITYVNSFNYYVDSIKNTL